MAILLTAGSVGTHIGIIGKAMGTQDHEARITAPIRTTRTGGRRIMILPTSKLALIRITGVRAHLVRIPMTSKHGNQPTTQAGVLQRGAMIGMASKSDRADQPATTQTGIVLGLLMPDINMAAEDIFHTRSLENPGVMMHGGCWGHVQNSKESGNRRESKVKKRRNSWDPDDRNSWGNDECPEESGNRREESEDRWPTGWEYDSQCIKYGLNGTFSDLFRGQENSGYMSWKTYKFALGWVVHNAL